MNIFWSLVLGVVQGLTEFLPVSSSGHLLLLPALLKLPEPDLNTLAIAHGGTLLAVLIYFRQDIWAITLGVLEAIRTRRWMGSLEARLGWFILVGTIPAVVAGLTLKNFFDQVFGAPLTAAFLLMGTAAILFFSERKLSGHKPLAQMGWWDAIWIGLAQMVALFPGISRSGSTIAAGLVRGLDRETAARFGFCWAFQPLPGRPCSRRWI